MRILYKMGVGWSDSITDREDMSHLTSEVQNSNASVIVQELQPWKRRSFSPHELSYERAVESLSTNNPLIEIRRSGGHQDRWTVRYQ
jgi:hypothetical protein